MKDDKRKEYISWDSYFLGLAAMASFRSKDPSTQNGACIVDPESLNVLSLGYNGFPRGCSDDKFPWVREAEKESDTKYPYVEHAERNAIYNAGKNGIKLDNSVLYLYSEKGYYPCPDCARGIIQSGIKKVIMGTAINKNTDVWHWDESIRMFYSAAIIIEVLCFKPNNNNHPWAKKLSEKNSKVVSDFDLISNKMDKIARQFALEKITREKEGE